MGERKRLFVDDSRTAPALIPEATARSDINLV